MSLTQIERHEGPWIEADYLALPNDNRRIELLDGGLLMVIAGSHARVAVAPRSLLVRVMTSRQIQELRPDGGPASGEPPMRPIIARRENTPV